MLDVFNYEEGWSFRNAVILCIVWLSALAMPFGIKSWFLDKEDE